MPARGNGDGRATAGEVARRRHEWEAVRDMARRCRNCDLWKPATQTVFGEGPVDAPMMLIGEQPGDQEDLTGAPFVGPAGRLLDRALAEAGIGREQIYVSNAVKHFKFEPRGRRRIHKKPLEREIAACHGWLEREIELVAPRLVVAMGATAVRAVLGRAVPVLANRGRVLEPRDGPAVLVTVHPSLILRIPGKDREREYAGFVRDLRKGQEWVKRRV